MVDPATIQCDVATICEAVGRPELLFIHSTRTVVRWQRRELRPGTPWIGEPSRTKRANVVATALANKNARIAWAVPTHRAVYAAPDRPGGDEASTSRGSVIMTARGAAPSSGKPDSRHGRRSPGFDRSQTSADTISASGASTRRICRSDRRICRSDTWPQAAVDPEPCDALATQEPSIPEENYY